MKWFREVIEQPWLHTGLGDSTAVAEGTPVNAKKVALIMFLAVVTSVFFLFFMAYLERMELSDWYPLQEPTLLWFNTALLMAGSISMQMARTTVNGGRGILNLRLAMSGLLIIAFLAGQWFTWKALRAGGNYAAVNPSYAFFYLLTALHGVHLAGGLYVWFRTMIRSIRGEEAGRVSQSIGLCSIYWHYLLLIWLLLFALMLNT